jgi:hypothetical protein
MGPDAVIILPPVLNDPARFIEITEPMLIEAFIPDFIVQTFRL